MRTRQAVVVSRKMDTPTAVVAMLGIESSVFGIGFPLMGTQADMGGCHFPWRHLENDGVLSWYPDSQKRRMVVF